MVVLTRQKARARRDFDVKFRLATKFFRDILALAKSDMDQAYDWWWTETRKEYPWAIEATDDKLRRKAFRKVAKSCLKANKGSKIENVPYIQAIMAGIIRRTKPGHFLSS